MAYTPKYTHEDYEAFWRKDFMFEVQNCRNYISRLLEGQGKTKKEADKMVEEELKRTYPNGFESKFKCKEWETCRICNPNHYDDKPPF